MNIMMKFTAFCILGVLLSVTVSAAGQCFTENNDDVGNAATSATNAAETLISGSTEFGLALFSSVFQDHSGPNDNVVISPISVWSSMTATWHGARGQTKQQMEKVLKYGDDNQKRVSKLYHEMTDALQHNETMTSNYTFRLVDRLYFDENIQLRDCIVQHLDSETEKLKFAEDPDASRETINKWVENQTNQKILKLLPDDYIDSSTVMVLVNAAYFKGYWDRIFDEKNTKSQDFFVKPATKVTVEMMHQSKKQYSVAKTDELQWSAIELPYSGQETSLVILLPNENTTVEEMISKLNQPSLKSTFNSLKSTMVNLSVPKFKVTQSVELKDNLVKLGIQDLFQSGAADLSGFVDDKKLHVSFVRHKTYVDVHESGTEAAAATASGVSLSSLPIGPFEEFHVNRPFVFLIRDKKQDVILFIGAIRDPSI